MRIEEIDRIVTNPKGSGATHHGQCPVCEAGDPHGHHLYYSIGRNGKPVFHCQKSNCSYKDIAAALDLRRLYPQKEHKKREWEFIRSHTYHNEDGSIFAKKTMWRTEKGKTATWERYENGKYVKGLAGQKPPLYNLPGLMAGGSKVYIAEGEKDADTLAQLGLCATSAPNGASKDSKGLGNWREAYNAYFTGRNVVILRDNDEAGERQAAATARSLAECARSVKVLDLLRAVPQLPNKGDITDAYALLGCDKEKTLAMLYELERTTDACKPELPVPDFYEGRRFLHNKMGDYLIKACGVCKINGAIHIYDNGVYRRGEDDLYGFMLELAEELTEAKRREVYKYIKVKRGVPVKEVSPPNLIPFASRIYDVETDRFIEYSPEHVFLNRFPYDYKPDAPECASITGAIEAIAAGDKEVIDLLYETMGNCFYLLNSYRGAVALYGQSGSNGKSTLLNMIAQLIGRENASYLSLQDTAERFRLAEVYGKAANIGDDIPDSFLKDSSTFKKLVTGERVTAEKKGQDPFSFQSYAKMFFAMNELPPVSDKSKAFFGRLLLVPLNQVFQQGGNADASLKTKQWSQQEMECLTRHAVEGLKRLLKNGDFTRPACVAAAMAEYERENNPVAGFLEDFGSVTDKTSQEVYDAYKLWCERAGHKNTLTRQRFSRQVNITTGHKSKSYSVDNGPNVARFFPWTDENEQRRDVQVV